jgi:hypothetical protein
VFRANSRCVETCILPFFPHSSDRGFSITDFKSVDPHLGTWQDIAELGKEYKLLFDGMLNHASAGDERIVTLTSVTGTESTIELSLSELGGDETQWHDLISDTKHVAEDQKLTLTLQPYDVMFLTPVKR